MAKVASQTSRDGESLAVAQEVAGSESSFGDMDDDEADLAQGPFLGPALLACREIVLPVYRRADAAALATQRQHRVIILVAVVCGTAAVLFAILQLSGLLHDPAVGGRASALDGPMPEAIAAVIALASVLLGLVAARQLDWLLARHQAERCRLLKFRFLADPRLLSGDPAAVEARVEELRRAATQIAQLTRKDMHKLIQEDQLPGAPPDLSTGLVDRGAMALADYYVRKRLRIQQAYFEKRLRENERMDRYTRNLSPIFFFGSVLAALSHFGYDEYAVLVGSDRNPTASAVLIVLAAGPAVIGAGVRTFRSAHEFSRNTSRFRAKLVGLRHVHETLERANPVSIYRGLWYSEQFLESEHREWLRLMMDAEWFA